MTFKEILYKKDTEEYFDEIDFHERIDKQMEWACKYAGIILENIIEPYNINIKTHDIKKLNKQFKKEKIIFNNGELRAFYNQEDNTIEVFISEKDNFRAIEAMIGHEMIHREQNKRSGKNYFKQSKKLVNRINNLIPLVNKGDEKAVKEQEKLLDYFMKSSPYEQMAYAYQIVKTYKNKTPREMIKILEKNNLKVDKKMLKYIGMYWLIRDKI